MPWEKQFNRDETLDRIMQTFWLQGYEATSMQDIVSCSGVNRASLYATWGDKHALFLSALESYDQNRKKMLTRLAETSSARAAIAAVFESFLSGVSQDTPNRGCFMTNTALELAAHDPAIRKIVAEAQSGVEDFFARMIRKGKANGEFNSGLRTREAARGLLASFIGLLVLMRSRPERSLLQGIVQDALRRLD